MLNINCYSSLSDLNVLRLYAYDLCNKLYKRVLKPTYSCINGFLILPSQSNKITLLVLLSKIPLKKRLLSDCTSFMNFPLWIKLLYVPVVKLTNLPLLDFLLDLFYNLKFHLIKSSILTFFNILMNLHHPFNHFLHIDRISFYY